MKRKNLGKGRPLALAAILGALVLMASASSAAASPIKRGIYKGSTSAGGKVSLEVAPNAKSFKTGSIAYTATCTDGSKFSDFVPGDGLPIDNGVIGGTIDLTDSKSGANIHIEVEGAFSPNGKDITGTFSFKLTQGADSCETGTVNYNAHFSKVHKKKKKRRHHR